MIPSSIRTSRPLFALLTLGTAAVAQVPDGYVVFGTFLLPRDREAPAHIGIDDMPGFPAGYLAQLASPFRWRRLRRAAGATAG